MTYAELKRLLKKRGVTSEIMEADMITGTARSQTESFRFHAMTHKRQRQVL